MPDLGTVTVAVRGVLPPMPAEHLLDQSDANGLAWQVHDVGPINGSILTAVTRAGDETVLLSAQAPSFDPTGVPQRQITEIARTAHPT